MNQQNIRNLTLFDLLARSWALPSAVETLEFSDDSSVAAFACADGTIALAALTDPEPPESRVRVSGDLGQTTIRPREKPLAPLIVTERLLDGAPLIAASGQSGFLAGASDGRIVRVAATGEIDNTDIRLDGAIVALDHARGQGLTAVSDGADVVLATASGGTIRSLRHGGGNVAALGFSPSGRQLAVCRDHEISIWTLVGEPALIRTIGFPHAPAAVRWSADTEWVACPLASGGFGVARLADGKAGAVSDFPAPARTVSWSERADALIASGAFRIAAWSMKLPPLEGETGGALVTGRPGLVVVEAVAGHPTRPLAAAGFANGQIVIARIGERDELLVKPSGGAITALDWSADGRHLAAGTANGGASLITFPAQMFK
ncbi:MAG: hypothetical protein EOR68_19910 [Mesorhizobium sp.]|uniref:WD40 repeat domain-containing protein n=1 Tax=Mesorhizobium sp. TaxID=1871066 RepID=UPI000FEAB2AF|nr:hypothetical protein [Mesorhizobium sp.]RWL95793.1 MAG: hypothetical protein EOR68_19910 [Mesorhizobium sp.]TIP06548.1 MAG: hypothetical protein E5X72_02225 [Mesorhizobium sp.]